MIAQRTSFLIIKGVIFEKKMVSHKLERAINIIYREIHIGFNHNNHNLQDVVAVESLDYILDLMTDHRKNEKSRIPIHSKDPSHTGESTDARW